MCAVSPFSCVQLFVTLWTTACQASLSVGFSSQEYWSGLPCPPPRNLPDLGVEPKSLMSPALAEGFFTTSTAWKGHLYVNSYKKLTFKSKSFENEILFEGFIFCKSFFHVFLQLQCWLLFFSSDEDFQKCIWFLGFPGGSVVKNLPAIQETQKMWVQLLAWENPPEEGMTTQCSIFPCRIPRTEEPGGLQPTGSHRAEHDWRDWAHRHTYGFCFVSVLHLPVHWKVCVFLPWKE